MSDDENRLPPKLDLVTELFGILKAGTGPMLSGVIDERLIDNKGVPFKEVLAGLDTLVNSRLAVRDTSGPRSTYQLLPGAQPPKPLTVESEVRQLAGGLPDPGTGRPMEVVPYQDPRKGLSTREQIIVILAIRRLRRQDLARMVGLKGAGIVYHARLMQKEGLVQQAYDFTMNLTDSGKDIAKQIIARIGPKAAAELASSDVGPLGPVSVGTAAQRAAYGGAPPMSPPRGDIQVTRAADVTPRVTPAPPVSVRAAAEARAVHDCKVEIADAMARLKAKLNRPSTSIEDLELKLATLDGLRPLMEKDIGNLLSDIADDLRRIGAAS